MAKTVTIDVHSSLLLIICNYPVSCRDYYYPDSQEWRTLLNDREVDRITFETDTDWGEVDLGYIQRQDDYWRYSFKQGRIWYCVDIKYQYFSWFCLDYIWSNYQRLRDEVLNIDPHLIKDTISIRTNYFNRVYLQKIVTDFKKLNPDAEVMLIKDGTETPLEKIDLKDFPPDKYHVARDIQYLVRSRKGIDVNHYFRLVPLLQEMDSGEELFEKYYAKKENMFVD